MKELLKKKSTKAALLLIVVAVIAVIVGMNVQSAQKEKEYNAHIEAAEKYLTELDYEQAIAEYTLALEIEPNAEEVLNGLEKTYLAYADSLADAGEYEKAIQVLNEGYAQTGRESLQEKITQIQEMQAQIEEEERLEAERAEILQPYMQQMYDLMAAEDYEQTITVLSEMEHLEIFESLLAEGPYLYFPQENDVQTGIGVGIYPVHDWHFWDGNDTPLNAVYYGDFVAGKREGNGVSQICRWTGAVFRGEWKNDAPNGYGEVMSGFLNDNIQEKKITTGNLVDGLWDGTVNVQNHPYLNGDGNTHYWDYTLQVTNGIPEDRTEDYLVEIERTNGIPFEDEDAFVYAYLVSIDPVSGMEDVGCLYVGYEETMGIWEFANTVP